MTLKSMMGIVGRLAAMAIAVSIANAADGIATAADMSKPVKIFAGYKAKGTATEPPAWVDKKTGKPIAWYAGKQYDDDVSYAKAVLADLNTYYPGAAKYELAGFFFWQGEKD